MHTQYILIIILHQPTASTYKPPHSLHPVVKSSSRPPKIYHGEFGKRNTSYNLREKPQPPKYPRYGEAHGDGMLSTIPPRYFKEQGAVINPQYDGYPVRIPQGSSNPRLSSFSSEERFLGKEVSRF